MSRSTYTTYNSPSQAIEDSKKRTSLLKDNSWIKKPDEEDETVDRDPNFGRSVLGRYKTTETVVSSEPSQSSTFTSRTSTTSASSVGALTKRFTTNQDELDSSSPTRTSYTRNTYSSVTSPKSTTTTTVTGDGKTTETTITTTTQKSSNKTDSFTERVFSDKTKGSLYTSYSPSKKTTVTETTTTSSSSNDGGNKLYDSMKDSAEDKLYDTLIPSTIKDESKRITTETVTISSNDLDDVETTTSTRSSTSAAEDQLYDTLIPLSISKPSTPTSSSITKRDIYSVSSSGSDSPTFSSTTRTSSYSSYTDPSSRTSTYTISSKTRSDDIMGDTYSRSSVKNIYTAPERPVLEKDLCSNCRKPFIGDAKIILDDRKINCHASCFKCEVCNSTLGHLKAGDSMWIYKNMVHCERCYEVTRDKWRR
ncbi:sciellin isoform X2 [Boleophthalmus pectinirostris]|uniref:sciellin isoform X2 n=1 Tax=Boleophthalmus pectinirostris TaxID=150288 RepID=UPI00242F9761|nr:sciellin isoform X2 [Boleophthalmus pectinirostris]